MKNFLMVVSVLAVLAPAALVAQDRPARWRRSGEPTQPPVTVFHATQSANLATAESLRRGEWLFEISHRFLPAVSDGSEALWGLDGPVFNRLGLSYAATDRLMLGILRSNLADNVELNAKLRIAEGGRDAVPFMVALNGGVAWNTQLPNDGGFSDNESQAYGQLIVNALLGESFAVGVVPTVLRNPSLEETTASTVLALGLNAQLYLSPQVSLFGEWVVAEARADVEHDPGSFGLELETGGHFFRLLLSNTARMNPTHFLAGTPFSFEPDEWRLGFNITRVLTF